MKRQKCLVLILILLPLFLISCSFKKEQKEISLRNLGKRIPTRYIGNLGWWGNPDYYRKICKTFPELLYWAKVRHIDPFLVTAIAYVESFGNSCYINCVPDNAYYKDKCNFDSKTINPKKLFSPCDSRTCKTDYVKISENAPCEYVGKTSDGKPMGDGECKPCKFGLMGRIDMPSSSVAHPSFMEMGNSECGPSYNPFDPFDSACVGTKELVESLRFGEKFVKEHPTWFLTDTDNTNKQILDAIYLGLYTFNEGVKTVIKDACQFRKQLSVSTNRVSCRKNDFIDWLIECKKVEYPSRVFAIYNKIRLSQTLQKNCLW